MKRAVIVIPNQEILDVPIFCRDIRDDQFHGMGVKNFSNLYHLGITAESLSLEEDDYPGQVYQLALASLGHAVLCMGEYVAVYLPEKLSFNQQKWFREQYSLLNRPDFLYLVVNSQGDLVEKGDSYSCENVIEKFYFYINSSVIDKKESGCKL